MKVELNPLCGALGAEVHGVDLSEDLDSVTLNSIKESFHENIVLLFRKQSLTPEQHVDFTSFFGPVEAHPLGSREGAQAQPEILVLENRADTPAPRNDFWHSDISFAKCPPLGSVLHALEVPGEGLGDTLFCNMYKVFEELSPGLQKTLEGLRALHSAEALVRRNNANDNNAKPITSVPGMVSHPVVRTHPETGRKALYVNPYYTESFEGWTPAESRLLLEWLTKLATRQENIYRHRWRQGDLLMWDNRCAMHYAVYDYGSKPRLFHRATAAGDRPV
jgi:taurine dioxygenase